MTGCPPEQFRGTAPASCQPGSSGSSRLGARASGAPLSLFRYLPRALDDEVRMSAPRLCHRRKNGEEDPAEKDALARDEGFGLSCCLDLIIEAHGMVDLAHSQLFPTQWQVFPPQETVSVSCPPPGTV